VTDDVILEKHNYVLDDNIFTFLPYTPAQGEYYDVGRHEQIEMTHVSQQKLIYKNVFLLQEMSTVHARIAFNFLDVLANVGGIQLVLTLLFTYLLASGPESWALMNILKKFFIIKSKD